MKELTCFEIEAAVNQLSRSDKGRAAMRDLLAFLDNAGLSLDELNRDAIFTLLAAAFTKYPGTARDLMREALDEKVKA
jgi:hypothetical protein